MAPCRYGPALHRIGRNSIERTWIITTIHGVAEAANISRRVAMNAIDNFNDLARRSLCLAMAFAIVTFGLTIGSASADAAFACAYGQAFSTHVDVV